jgi:hypothetical protein
LEGEIQASALAGKSEYTGYRWQETAKKPIGNRISEEGLKKNQKPTTDNG